MDIFRHLAFIHGLLSIVTDCYGAVHCRSKWSYLRDWLDQLSAQNSSQLSDLVCLTDFSRCSHHHRPLRFFGIFDRRLHSVILSTDGDIDKNVAHSRLTVISNAEICIKGALELCKISLARLSSPPDKMCLSDRQCARYWPWRKCRVIISTVTRQIDAFSGKSSHSRWSKPVTI